MTRWEASIFGRRVTTIGILLAIAIPVLAAVASKRHYFEVPYGDERRLNARLDLALGKVRIGQTMDDLLFQAEVVIENEKLTPYFNFSTRDREGYLDIDLESEKGSGSVSLSGLSAASSSDWLLLFSDRVPLNLDIDLGAAKGDLDFTGLPIEELRFEAGASRADLRFDEPNPIVMEKLEITAGASDVNITGLGYARARRVRFTGGVGRYTLDFADGELLHGARADIEIGMAALTVVIPKGLPVVVHAPANWLCTVDIPVGYTKRGKGTWFSEEAKGVDEPFEVSIEAGMGKITVRNP